jgi:hypothetical protein
MLAPASRARGKLCAALALLAALVPLACGQKELTSGDEGELVHAGDAIYQVQLTRPLNPRQRPDESLVRGQLNLGKGEEYLAVFMKIENEGDKPYAVPRTMKVIDSEGNAYLPLDSSQTGFGLDFAEPIAPGEKAPPPNSPADQGPNKAAMVLFRIKTTSVTDNLPLELEIPTGSDSSSRVRLDV